MNPALDAFLDGLEHLPPAPPILPQLIATLREPDIDSERVALLLTFDPSLTAAVLRFCNSAYLAASRPADTVEEAVTRMGFTEVYRLVCVITTAQALSPPHPGYGLASGELWRHAVTSAVAAEVIARDRTDDDTLAFTAGLLHDLGKIVLSEPLLPHSARLFEETERQGRSLLETEKLLLGFDHAEAGGRLLARWNLPESLVGAVAHHHEPSAAGPHSRLAAYACLGDLTAHLLGAASGCVPFATRARAEVFDLLGLAPDRWPIYLLRTWDRFQIVRSLLDVRG